MYRVRNWTGFPERKVPGFPFRTGRELKNLLRKHRPCIPHGSGRSYSDCCLGNSAIVSGPFSHILSFDPLKGILRCESGTTLRKIIEFALPGGWFPEITPGTAHVTVGGAIAGDVHGKNHHLAGCFSNSVLEMELLLPSGEILTLKPGHELFHATCGGLGLTGFILNATIRLKRVRSGNIRQLLFVTRNLAETLEIFEKYGDVSFSAGWLDGTARGRARGRGVILLGEFADDGDLSVRWGRAVRSPSLPFSVVTGSTVRLFNAFYFLKALTKQGESVVSFREFFYPLDSLDDWYGLYGRKGFLQYQFVLPLKTGAVGLDEVLYTVSRSGIHPSLVVIKRFGPENRNLLSFPMEGYTLAMDFPLVRGVFHLLKTLDRLVLKYGGRLYLCKDARVSREMFERTYPGADEFRKIRKKYDLKDSLRSFLSERIKI